MDGAHLAELRKQRGLSQSELAAQLGVSRETIRDIEVGKQSGRAFIEQIAEILGVDPYELDPTYTPGGGPSYNADPRLPLMR